jgi:hypothetical protein
MAIFLNASAKRTRRLSALAAASCLGLGVALAGAATPAAAGMVAYDFVGNCSGCSGMGVGEIVLKDFTPGQQLTAANFVNFTFTTSAGQILITPAQLASFSGLLDPTNLSGAHFAISAGGQTFDSTGTGFWQVLSSLNGAFTGGGGGGGDGGRQAQEPAFDPPSLPSIPQIDPPSPPQSGFSGADDTESFQLDSIDAQLPAAVPEPASWALMIGGFAGMGGVLRRRKRPAASIEIA